MRSKRILKPGVYSLIVPSIDAHSQLLTNLLEDMIELCSLPYEVVVVDNASMTDELALAIKPYEGSFQVKYYRTTTKMQIYDLVRIGAQLAETEVILVSDSDIRIPDVTRSRIRPKYCPDPFGYLVYLVARNEHIGLFYPGIIRLEEPIRYLLRAVDVVVTEDDIKPLFTDRMIHIASVRAWEPYRLYPSLSFPKHCFATTKELFLSIQIDEEFKRQAIWPLLFGARVWADYDLGIGTSTDILVAHPVYKPPKPKDDLTLPGNLAEQIRLLNEKYHDLFERAYLEYQKTQPIVYSMKAIKLE